MLRPHHPRIDLRLSATLDLNRPRKALRMPVCNGHPERAPRLGRFCFPLCWRCTGAACAVCAGWLAGPPTLSAWWLVVAALAILPAYVDGVAQYEYARLSNNPRRFITGLGLGAGLVVARAVLGLS
jgi:uncharacterized membrane protein